MFVFYLGGYSSMDMLTDRLSAGKEDGETGRNATFQNR